VTDRRGRIVSSRFYQSVVSYLRSTRSSVPEGANGRAREPEGKEPEFCSMNPGLANDIVSFVCDKQLTDVEILRKAICCQSRRAQLRLSGDGTLLRMLHVNPPLGSTSQVALFTGYLGCLAPQQPEPACLAYVDLIPIQERESELVVRKLLLRWCSSQLQQTIWDCDSHGTVGLVT